MTSDLDAIAIFLSITSLIIYHASFYGFVTKRDVNIQLSINVVNSCNWIRKHYSKSDAQSVTLAIQTIRNTIIVAVFVGGTALQFGLGFLNSYKDALLFYSKLRIAILSSFLFLSFLFWASVIRLASHLGYLIGTMEYNSNVEVELEVENGIINSRINESSKLLPTLNKFHKLDEAERMIKNLVFSFRFILS
jgi:ABC-type transport system involved in Fe-S cluster assembly fused permease/ATPase subunit